MKQLNNFGGLYVRKLIKLLRPNYSISWIPEQDNGIIVIKSDQNDCLEYYYTNIFHYITTYKINV